MPSSTVEKPAMLCPPPRTATVRSLLRAKPTAAIDVGRAGTADDQRRAPAVVHAVPDPGRLGVPVVLGGDDLAAHGLAQLLDRRFPENRCECLAHVLLPFLVV